MRRWLLTIVATPALLALAPRGIAQGEVAPQTEPAAKEPVSEKPVPEPPPMTLSLKAGSGYAFRTDLDDADTSVSRLFAGGGFDLAWSTSRSLRLSFGTEYEYIEYDFEGASNLIGALDDDPFDQFNTIGFSLGGTYVIDDRWFLTVGGFATGGWEAGADVGDAWTGGGFTTVGFNAGEGLTLGVGVGASTQLEAGPIVFPAIIVRWQVSEALRLETQRLGVRATYAAADDLDFYLRANWERREYRLDDGHATIGDGVLRDTTVPVGAGVEWRPLAGLSLGLEAGALVYSRLKFRNESGNTVADSELDPGGYVSVRVEYSF